MFFHKQAAVRQHFNTVKEIQHNNNLLTEFEEIKQAAHDHFKDIYSESYGVPEAGTEEILDRIPRKVSPKNNLKLIAQVTLEEIQFDLEEMSPGKAPGLDGFTA